MVSTRPGVAWRTLSPSHSAARRPARTAASVRSRYPVEGAKRESVIHAEVDRQTDPDELEALTGHLLRVIGEVLSGIVLGPTVLGRIAPSAPAWLFPPEVPLKAIADLGEAPVY